MIKPAREVEIVRPDGGKVDAPTPAAILRKLGRHQVAAHIRESVDAAL